MGKRIETNEQVVVERIKAGDRQIDIATALGVSRQWVALFAKRNGLSRNKAGRPAKYDHAEIVRLIDGGESAIRVMKAVGAPTTESIRSAYHYWKRRVN